jgi:hypothetical protein
MHMFHFCTKQSFVMLYPKLFCPTHNICAQDAEACIIHWKQPSLSSTIMHHTLEAALWGGCSTSRTHRPGRCIGTDPHTYLGALRHRPGWCLRGTACLRQYRVGPISFFLLLFLLCLFSIFCCILQTFNFLRWTFSDLDTFVVLKFFKI